MKKILFSLKYPEATLKFRIAIGEVEDEFSHLKQTVYVILTKHNSKCFRCSNYTKWIEESGHTPRCSAKCALSSEYDLLSSPLSYLEKVNSEDTVNFIGKNLGTKFNFLQEMLESSDIPKANLGWE